jgi:hypothetical protein
MKLRRLGSIRTLSWVTLALCGACASTRQQAAAPTNASTGSASTAASAAPSPGAESPQGGVQAPQKDSEGQARPRVPSDQLGSGEPNDDDNVELVVDGDVVARCPKLRLVRRHVEQFDPEMVWLAVLESIADCMREGGPMAADTLGVSGTEDHRHIVRQVLSSRGVAPTRVISAPQSSEGAAECQGAAGCTGRVEIMLSPSP